MTASQNINAEDRCACSAGNAQSDAVCCPEIRASARRVAVDIRIAQLDAERAQLTSQKQKLAAALTEFAKPAALGKFRDVILKGHRFTAPSIGKIPKPKKPKEPGP